MRIYTLPFEGDINLINPEQAILEFPPKGTIDIGSICYLIRDFNSTYRKKTHGRRVELSSLDTNRIERTREIITLFSNKIQNDSLSPTTVSNEARMGCIDFIDWADETGHHRAILDAPAARRAFSEYVTYLLEKYRRHEIKLNTAAVMCRHTLNFISSLFSVDDFHNGLNIPTRNIREINETIPPSETAQGRAMALCHALFHGLTQLALDYEPFPYRIQIPEYLNWNENFLWVFPTPAWFRTPREVAEITPQKDKLKSYKFLEGRVATTSELTPFFSSKRIALQSKRRAIANITAANSDPRNKHRILLATHALNSFAILFLANTGINLTQLLELEWNDEYLTTSTRQKFKAIKWRASGKLQSFEIQSEFLKDFKLFIKLRSYLLNGGSYRFLFFTLGTGQKSKPSPMKYFATRDMHSRLRRIDPTLPSITPRQWRAGKIDWMLRNKVPMDVAADVAQNSERTLKTSYAAGSPETHKKEMTVFFENLCASVIDESQKIQGMQDSPAGHCINYGNPFSSNIENNSIPNCRNPEGCFFCDHYKVHADEIDTRKLVSCRYCIQRTAPLASSVEHFEETFGTVLNRINHLLFEISRRAKDKHMVKRIEKSVEEDGELDSYWLAKLELLFNLDLIST